MDAELSGRGLALETGRVDLGQQRQHRHGRGQRGIGGNGMQVGPGRTFGDHKESVVDAIGGRSACIMTRGWQGRRRSWASWNWPSPETGLERAGGHCQTIPTHRANTAGPTGDRSARHAPPDNVGPVQKSACVYTPFIA